MKWMSATAVFAAVLPSVSGFCFPESKELNFSRTGTSSSTTFTETIAEEGAEYIVSGNASFTNFTNIPVKTTTSNTSTSTPTPNSKPSADKASTGKLVSATSSSSGTPENPTETPDPKGGGAFYNQFSGVLSFMTRSGTEGSLTLSNIKMTGDGGAIFSQGDLLFTDLTGLTIQGNLSQQSGGGIFGGSKISLSGITQATFSSNAAEIVVAAETPPTEKAETSSTAKPETVTAPTTTTTPPTTTPTPTPPTTTPVSNSSGSNPSSAHSRFICASANPTTGSDTSSDPRPGSGGAIYAKEDFTVSDSKAIVFSTNKASKDGGAIFAEKNILFENIGSLKVQSNGAEEKGGGIYARGDLSIQSSKQILFNSNTSKQGGGALYIEGDVKFQDLEELHIKYNKAGTFETKKVTLSLPKSTDKNSLAASSQSDSNTASSQSGSGTVSPQPGTDAGTTTPTPPVTAKGGGIYTDQNLSISNVTGIIEIANNKATDVGGGAYVKGTLTCENSHRLQFLKNSSDKKGGGLYTEDSITLSNLTGKTLFQENTAKEEGGGLFIKEDKPLTMTGLDSFCLINNTSAKSGGGAYVSKEISQTYTATIEEFPGITPVHGETIITGNKATGGSGGGVCTKRLALSNLQTVLLSENSASENGGGAYTCPDNFPSPVADSSTTTVPSSTTGTPSPAGAPAAAASSSLFFLTAATDPAATAPKADQESNADKDPNADKDFLIDYVVNTTISKNTATKKGAGVYAKKAKLSRIDALNISENSAQETGGGICCTESLELDAIVSLSATGNRAGKEGGALHAKTLTVSNLQSGFSFSNNTANSSSTGTATTATQPTSSPGAALPQASAGGAPTSSPTTTPSPTTSSPTPSPTSSQTTLAYAGVVGGAIYGETVSFSKCSGLCQFSGNSAIDNTPSSPSLNVQGGAIYAKTSLSIEAEDSSTSYVFAGNSVSSGKAPTSGQIAGGAICSPTITLKCPTTFSKNTASMATAAPSSGSSTPDASGSSIKDTIGGAIAGTTISLSGTSRFSENAADLGAAIGTLSLVASSAPQQTPADTEKISLENGSFSFEKNKANKRGAIYAPTVSIKGNNITFNQNTSKHDGSAIYFTKDATIESLGSVLFTGNNVTNATAEQANSQTSGQITNTKNYGAAIFGDPGSSQQTDATLKLIASSGNITFSNNSQNTKPDSPANQFCSIAGYVKLSLQAAQGRSISFFDSIHTSTKKTGQAQNNYESLDINQTDRDKTYSGTISFSSELHENKSYIPQKVVLHNGTLVLKENTELHVVSFEQKPGSSLIMEPGAVLSNQNIANGALAINGLTIDLSSMGTPKVGEIFSPPELRIVATSSNAAGGVGGVGGKVTASKELYTAAASAVPGATSPAMGDNKVFLTGNLTLIDPNGNFYQNPLLGTDLSNVPLIKLPSNNGEIDVSALTLSGDLAPKKGYIGTWTLNPDPQTGKIVANWKFDMYRRWVYIPRDNHFYANSILGSQNSMIVVKQGLINNMLSNARFDDIAYNNFWVSGVGTFLAQQGTPLSEEFSYYSRGTSVAIDAKPRPDFILGAAFSKMVGRTKAIKKVHNYFHKGSEYSYQASVYGGKFLYFLLNKQHGWALPFLLQGVVSYGHIKHDTTTRYPSIHELNKGDWEDLGWLADLRVSMDLKEPSKNSSKRVSLYGELEYSSIRQKSFTEIDYDPRHFDDCAYRNLSVPVGCSFEGAIMSYDILMYNKLSLAYMPSIYRNSPVCKYRVLSSNETGEVVCGVPTRTSARAEYSTQLYLGPFWTLYGNYTIDVGMYTLSQMTSCGARMIF
ncbi:polymorphic outer membrane protein middle domain-containing protein [Chlamydia suis]|uniref:polymorphic outer membrane protein middle domain-containing protein n=1 Tax=Chlamydia suis TaxID=83559 RepID=UPI0009AF6D3B|nr:polymorphic outer membrane protein middle domain-containing protein [Chlamydia suis]